MTFVNRGPALQSDKDITVVSATFWKQTSSTFMIPYTHTSYELGLERLFLLGIKVGGFCKKVTGCQAL